MSVSNFQPSWNVGRVTGICAACGAELPANTTCWAALCDRPAAPHDIPPQPDPPPQRHGGTGVGGGGGKSQEPPPSPFIRVDFCEKCWSAGRRPGDAATEPVGAGGAGAGLAMFSYWKTVVPTPQQKRKLLVDDSVLMDVFTRMEGKSEPQDLRFRFVLALILMRKRLLKYDGTEAKSEIRNPKSETPGEAPGAASAVAPAPPETWRMIPRGQENPVHVVNPHLTAEQIAEVSQQLSAILAEEI